MPGVAFTAGPYAVCNTASATVALAGRGMGRSGMILCPFAGGAEGLCDCGGEMANRAGGVTIGLGLFPCPEVNPAVASKQIAIVFTCFRIFSPGDWSSLVVL